MMNEIEEVMRSRQSNTASFPRVRLRRTRNSPQMRRLMRETNIRPDDLIYPLFVAHGRNVRNPIEPMPGQFQLSVDQVIKEVDELNSLGIPAVLLFGLPLDKDDVGTEAYDREGIVQIAIAAIKDKFPQMIVITDVCLCEYTDHGHCGVLNHDGSVDNDETLKLLAAIAVSHGQAGADIVAPSAMMDGQVVALRSHLDAADMASVSIMAYAAKFASAFYGPFRVAAESAPKTGDRRTYQMDGANPREAIREIQQDVLEGADVIMIKPALAYLDVLSRARELIDHPMAAYNVSGEYSMLKAAASNGWIDEDIAVLETLTSIKRAGADLIITYFAKDAARLLH